MKALIRVTASLYNVGDIVSIVEDDHVFSVGDLSNGREQIPLGALTDENKAKLLMQDEAITNFSAISQLPTFKSFSTSSRNLKALHRRKYVFDNGVVLKPNAQERT